MNPECESEMMGWWGLGLIGCMYDGDGEMDPGECVGMCMWPPQRLILKELKSNCIILNEWEGRGMRQRRQVQCQKWKKQWIGCQWSKKEGKEKGKGKGKNLICVWVCAVVCSEVVVEEGELRERLDPPRGSTPCYAVQVNSLVVT